LFIACLNEFRIVVLQGEDKVRAAKSGEAALKMMAGGNPPDLAYFYYIWSGF
jgi:hypothetical protein